MAIAYVLFSCFHIFVEDHGKHLPVRMRVLICRIH
jgi:hypothetical protein